MLPFVRSFIVSSFREIIPIGVIGNMCDKLEFVELFEYEICTGALQSPQGEGGPPLGGG